MSDLLDPIPNPDGMSEENVPDTPEPQDLPIDVSEPASLPIAVLDETPVKKASKPADPAKPSSASPAIPTPVEPAKSQSDADKKKKTWIIVAVVVLLLICCCCVLPMIGSSAGLFEEIMREFGATEMLLQFAV